MAIYLCPHCQTEIDYNHLNLQFFEVQDCAACFDIACPECEKIISVDVIPIPEFELSKAQQVTAWEVIDKALSQIEQLEKA